MGKIATEQGKAETCLPSPLYQCLITEQFLAYGYDFLIYAPWNQIGPDSCHGPDNTNLDWETPNPACPVTNKTIYVGSIYIYQLSRRWNCIELFYLEHSSTRFSSSSLPRTSCRLRWTRETFQGRCENRCTLRFIRISSKSLTMHEENRMLVWVFGPIT